MRVKVLMVAEFDIPTHDAVEEIQHKLDSFRDAVQPSNMALSLATDADLNLMTGPECGESPFWAEVRPC